MRVPRIYAIADARRWAPRSLPEVVAQLASAGWPWIQVRDKQAGDRQLLRLAEECVHAAAGTGCRIWVNDRADIAAMSGAWGVHLGSEDPPPEAIRDAFPQLRIAVTTRDRRSVARAEDDPAVDVIAFGPVFSTDTKVDASPARGIGTLDAVRDATDKPLIAIGGIQEFAIPELRWAGANTVAVTGALVSQPSLVADWVSRYAPSDNHPWPRIFLTGFMATGKSCVGRRLAAVLGWEFIDLDSMVRKSRGSTIRELFAAHGESSFREFEAEALRRAGEKSKAVIACGGGVVESEENRGLLVRDRGIVVWLEVAEEELERRLAGGGPQRPLADSAWRSRLERRRRLYRETADIVVPVAAREPIQRTVRRTFDRMEAHR